jgi:hypothetical protein
VKTRLSAIVLALLAVLPMLAPLVWERGLPRVALTTDPALGALTPIEQPLTVRAFAGQWELLLVILWFGLAHTQRRAPVWEVALVLLGAALALLRLGNVWLTALLYVPALAARLMDIDNLLPRRGLLAGGLAAGLCLVTAGSLVASRAPGLPSEAATVVMADSGAAPVFTSLRWAPALQGSLGSRRVVLDAGQLSTDEAMDYLRVSLAHANWDDVLRQHDVGLVVLDAAGSQSGAAAEVRKAPGWQVALDADGVLVARRADR